MKLTNNTTRRKLTYLSWFFDDYNRSFKFDEKYVKVDVMCYCATFQDDGLPSIM